MWVVTVKDNSPGATEEYSVWRTGYPSLTDARRAVEDAVKIDWLDETSGVVYDEEEGLGQEEDDPDEEPVVCLEYEITCVVMRD